MCEGDASAAMDLSKALITESNVRAALMKDKGDEAQLLSWSIHDFTKKGENYAARVTSVLVRYTLENAESQVSYVVKLNPCREMGDFDQGLKMLFHKEALFLEKLVPALNETLMEKGLIEPLRAPRCFYSSLEPNKEIIFLEDLRSRGFKSFEKKALDIPHTTLVVQELARLNAASLLLQHSVASPDILQAMDYISDHDWLKFSEEKSAGTKEIIFGNIDIGIKLLEKIPAYGRAKRWLEKLKPDALEVIEKAIQKCPPFTVLCHGDCWVNNLLFRYDKSDAPAEVMLIDFQMPRFSSPALDLRDLTYVSLGSDERKNIPAFLKIYHNTFSEVLQAGGLPVPFTLEQLGKEFEDKCLYGISFSLMFLPLSVSGEEEAPDMDDLSKTFAESIIDMPSERIEELSKDPDFYSRFFSVFDDLMESGVIP